MCSYYLLNDSRIAHRVFKVSYSVAAMTIYCVFFICLATMKVAAFKQKFDRTY